MKDVTELKKTILNNIRLQDILLSEGEITGALEEEQVHCPFHGADLKKSARYYSSSDSIYCWVCRESWDLFSYISKKNNYSFSESLKYLISFYRIDISNVPEVTDILGTDKIKGEKQQENKSNDRIKYLMQLYDLLIRNKKSLKSNKYAALVYSYMVMKYMVSDKNFPENASKMNETLIRVLRK